MRMLILIAVVLLAGCREWVPPVFEEAEALPNVTLGDLRAYLRGEAEVTFAEDLVVAGRVVSSDAAGNFYNTFFIDDGTGAAEIMAGIPDMAATYRPGQRVSVRLRGLAAGWRDGAMQIGLPPEAGNRFATGYFYHRAVIGRWVTAERSVEPVEPLSLEVSELRPEFAGRPVRISGLVADIPPDTSTGPAGPSPATWATAQPQPVTGYTRFRTATGAGSADSITVVTSGYARFAAASVPRGEVTLTGILFYGRGGSSRDHFLLKLRDEQDIDY